MGFKNEYDKEENRKKEEYKKNPIINFADSMNRSKIGGLSELSKSGLFTKFIIVVIIIGILFFVSKYSYS